MSEKPNVIFVFADQWRADACGYFGNEDVKTPNLDRLAEVSVNVENAVAGCPVCSPYRASLLTGQYPLTHGVFENDVLLNPTTYSLGKVFKEAGYDTAYIGKWHLDGSARSAFTPPERRQGFDYWKVLNCTHDYNQSLYYTGRDTKGQVWEDYDAFAQTRDAQRYIEEHASGSPFLLMLSWGPPHAPYETAPEGYRALYDPQNLQLRANVPERDARQARDQLAGYYAHITALDDCIGSLLESIRDCGIEENTLFVFTSDHGDMLGSQGNRKKQQPWEESIHVPFLMRYPKVLRDAPAKCPAVLDAPDIMPTLLSLCGLNVPDGVEGTDFSPYILGHADGNNTDALLMCPVPFGQWAKEHGGREYRGVRTPRYTYVRDLNGPWLLYDNQRDPFQLENLCNTPEYAGVQTELEHKLQRKLENTADTFEHADVYIRRLQAWGYEISENGTTRCIP